MNINDANLELSYKGFKKVFEDAFTGAVSHRDTVAMVVKSQTYEENYAWLGQFPALREWIGDRVVKRLASHGFRITNRKFESTVEVKREDFEDDRIGVYAPHFQEMGRSARQHPDTLIFDLLSRGFEEGCYDGRPFFSDDHPVTGAPADVTGPVMTNMQGGEGPTWYLFDTSRAVKPIIWQDRDSYNFQAITDPNNTRVFMTDRFLFGLRARVNCGFGLWQLAYASKAPLTSENYALARQTMMQYVGDEGQLIGVMPNQLVVPPALEARGRALINADVVDSTSNIWKGSSNLIVTPYLR